MDNQVPQTVPPATPIAQAATPPIAPTPQQTVAPTQPVQPATPPVAAPVAAPQQSAPAQSPSTGPTPPAPAPGIKPKISFDFDSRTKLTVQWSAIWYGVGVVIENVATQLSIFFTGGIAGEIFRSLGGIFETFSVQYLIKDMIWGVIIGAVAGFVLSKFYPQIQDLNRKYLKSKLNNMFKLLFYPSLVGAILGFLISTTAAFATGIMPLIIVAAGVIASSFIYAKMLSKKVEGLYQPPV